MRNTKLTVIMYHYVRDLKHSRYPAIKGLDTELFQGQLDYLQKHYRVVRMEDVAEAAISGKDLPDHAVLLTFDDGYSDHFMTVFPILRNRGLQGSFFAPVKALTENTVLDVNKIHFILASAEDHVIVKRIQDLLEKYQEQFGLDGFGYYYQKLARPSRFDPASVIFIKRLLQSELPLEARKQITTDLFRETVGIDEQAFSRELYMNREQMRCMIADGMHIGAHGFDHFWLGTLSPEQQRFEIEKSVGFLKELYGDRPSLLTMCYPYGNYNEDTLQLMREYGFQAGFTVEVKVADLSRDNIFTLPRLDTNDIPKRSDVLVNDWYYKS